MQTSGCIELNASVFLSSDWVRIAQHKQNVFYADIFGPVAKIEVCQYFSET